MCITKKTIDKTNTIAKNTINHHKTEKNEKLASSAPISKPVAAKYLNNPKPSYPLRARKRGYEGTALLKVLVSAEGLPKSVYLSQSSGHAILDRAALDTVKRWSFIPAKKGNTAVEASVEIPIRFNLGRL